MIIINDEDDNHVECRDAHDENDHKNEDHPRGCELLQRRKKDMNNKHDKKEIEQCKWIMTQRIKKKLYYQESHGDTSYAIINTHANVSTN